MLQQTDTSGGAWHFSALGFGQSFIPANNTTITGIELSMKASPFGSYASTIELRQYDSINRTLSPSILASGSILSSQVPETQEWVTFFFGNPTQLLANTTYAFVVFDGMPSSNQFYFSSSNKYDNGTWLNINATGILEMNIDAAFIMLSIPELSTTTLASAALLILALLHIKQVRNS